MSVSAGDFNGDGLADGVVGAGPDGGPHVKVVNTARAGERDSDRIADAALLANFFGYEEGFAGGIRVGMAEDLPGGDTDPGPLWRRWGRSPACPTKTPLAPGTGTRGRFGTATSAASRWSRSTS